ncbi:hypothetical protein P691DRAFT_484253 [Macrolepiota fuliginosa MF-IS2]|uniref:Uncharacterized protein n=1 Tax=Macrolepiota fuliginosa MF-IS2 TaxID=1400762 RepID=A0A9P5X2D1_9AGAR|nr:hypothetical protein P691DRAFT_484253 [Macrolepiota fuliginosa MF-IS2]
MFVNPGLRVLWSPWRGLYLRFFVQLIMDGASHNEALANRAAALNILDLTLEHLDIKARQAAGKGRQGLWRETANWMRPSLLFW